VIHGRRSELTKTYNTQSLCDGTQKIWVASRKENVADHIKRLWKENVLDHNTNADTSESQTDSHSDFEVNIHSSPTSMSRGATVHSQGGDAVGTLQVNTRSGGPQRSVGAQEEAHSTQDSDRRTNELLAQAQSGFSLELPSSDDVSSLKSSEMAPTASGMSLLQDSISSRTLLAMEACLKDIHQTHIGDSVVDPKLADAKASVCEIDRVMEAPPGVYVDMEQIPDEILLLCFSYLSPQELCHSVAPVCSRWHRLVYDCTLWKKLDISERRMTGPQLKQLVQTVAGGIRYTGHISL
jgi:hypothetical protein